MTSGVNLCFLAMMCNLQHLESESGVLLASEGYEVNGRLMKVLFQAVHHALEGKAQNTEDDLRF